MARTWKPRPLSPLRLSPLPESLSEVIYPGTSDEEDPKTTVSKKRRREEFAKDYLKGRCATLLSTSIHGPLPEGFNFQKQRSFRRRKVLKQLEEIEEKELSNEAKRQRKDYREVDWEQDSGKAMVKQNWRRSNARMKQAQHLPARVQSSLSEATESLSASLAALTACQDELMRGVSSMSGTPIVNNVAHKAGSPSQDKPTSRQFGNFHGSVAMGNGSTDLRKGKGRAQTSSIVRDKLHYPTPSDLSHLPANVQEGANAICGGVEALMESVEALIPGLAALNGVDASNGHAHEQLKKYLLSGPTSLEEVQQGVSRIADASASDKFDRSDNWRYHPSDDLAEMQEKIRLLRETCERFTQDEWATFVEQQQSLPAAKESSNLHSPSTQSKVRQIFEEPLASPLERNFPGSRGMRRNATELKAEKLAAKLAARTSEMASRLEDSPDHVIAFLDGPSSPQPVSQPNLREELTTSGSGDTNNKPGPVPGMAMEQFNRIMNALEKSKQLRQLNFSESSLSHEHRNEQSTVSGSKPLERQTTRTSSAGPDAQMFSREFERRIRSGQSSGWLETDKQPTRARSTEPTNVLDHTSTQAAIKQARKALFDELDGSPALSLPQPNHPDAASTLQDSIPPIIPFHKLQSPKLAVTNSQLHPIDAINKFRDNYQHIEANHANNRDKVGSHSQDEAKQSEEWLEGLSALDIERLAEVGDQGTISGLRRVMERCRQMCDSLIEEAEERSKGAAKSEKLKSQSQASVASSANSYQTKLDFRVSKQHPGPQAAASTNGKSRGPVMGTFDPSPASRRDMTVSGNKKSGHQDGQYPSRDRAIEDAVQEAGSFLGSLDVDSAAQKIGGFGKNDRNIAEGSSTESDPEYRKGGTKKVNIPGQSVGKSGSGAKGKPKKGKKGKGKPEA
ncbi:hypothetical protein MMC25_005493 [Agyrium rufum]|nr:hypothetical protein [Agyrium rufum]